MLKKIYLGAVEPVMLYGAEVWGERARDTRIRRHTNAAQRPFLRAITRAYRTAPTAALQVLTGLVPLDIRASERHRRRKDTAEGYEKRVGASETLHPSRRGLLSFKEWSDDRTARSIYTDGSVMDGRTAYAWVVNERGKWEDPVGRRLSDNGTIMQAEIRAIREAVGEASRRPGDTNIISDSRSALAAITTIIHTDREALEVYKTILEQKDRGKNIGLFWTKAHAGNEGNSRADEAAREATLKDDVDVEVTQAICLAKRKNAKESKEEWQKGWDAGSTGRMLHNMVRSVSTDALEASRKTVQLLTGHGNFAAYLKRFKLKEDGACDCDLGEEETAEHVLLRCNNMQRERARAKLMEAAVTCGAGWPIRINKETDNIIWRAINCFAEHAVENDDFAERAEEIRAE